MSRRARPITFGLLWHSPNSSNYGVGALTASHIALLETVASRVGVEPAFEIAGWSDPMPTYVSNANLRFHPFSRGFLTRPDGLIGLARRSRLVLDIAGGDSFTDLYGAKRFWYQALSKLIVLSTGTPLILAPQTIGPFGSAWSRAVAHHVMRRCAAVVSRDTLSSRFVRELDPAIRLYEATDVAFGLKAPAARIGNAGRIRVGVNVSGLLFAGGYRRSNDFSIAIDYAGVIRSLLERMLERGDCEIHLFSHVVIPRQFAGVAEDDLIAAESLASEFGPGVVVAPAYASPQETKAHIAGMDFFCGSRMHACIAAFSAGVATVPIAYSRKFQGVFGTLGYDLVADLKSDTADIIVEKVLYGLANRQRLQAEVARCNAVAQKRLETYASLVQAILTEGLEQGVNRAGLVRGWRV